MEYIAYLHKDRTSDFGVSFPDFPGCVTAGKTLEEARRMAPEALALHIEGMMEDGEDMPTPSTLDALADDPTMTGAVAFLVAVQPPEDKTVRVNIAARRSQVEQIDARAKRFGLSRSAYLIQAGLGQLEKRPRRRA
jgi:predicted RNase H-like HicB family nuclease